MIHQSSNKIVALQQQSTKATQKNCTEAAPKKMYVQSTEATPKKCNEAIQKKLHKEAKKRKKEVGVQVFS